MIKLKIIRSISLRRRRITPPIIPHLEVKFIFQFKRPIILLIILRFLKIMLNNRIQKVIPMTPTSTPQIFTYQKRLLYQILTSILRLLKHLLIIIKSPPYIQFNLIVIIEIYIVLTKKAPPPLFLNLI